jgi:hypothetical protein
MTGEDLEVDARIKPPNLMRDHLAYLVEDFLDR